MHRTLVAVASLALVIAACAPVAVSTSSPEAPSATPATTTAPEPTSTPTATPEPSGPEITPVQDGTPVPSDAGPVGQLVVTQSSVKDLPGVFTEGAIAYVEVYDA